MYEVALSTGATRAEVQKMLESLFEEITTALELGEKVHLKGIGSFEA